MRRLVLAVLAIMASLSWSAAAAGQGSPAAVDSGWVEVAGGRLYYEAAGRGPAVVLLHGGFGDRRMWDAQFGDLSRDFRVVRYDHRGFGRSPAADTAYSPVDDLARLLDHLRIDRAHLVGNSLGGALAIDFALLRPERVGKVIVVASGAGGVPYTPEDIAEMVAVFNAAQSQGAERGAELWTRHPMVAVTSREPATAPLLRAMVSDNRAIFTMRHWPNEPMQPRAYHRLGELRVPVLFVWGDRDTPFVQRAARESAARVPRAGVLILPGTDHLPQMLRPADFNRVVREYLGAP